MRKIWKNMHRKSELPPRLWYLRKFRALFHHNSFISSIYFFLQITFISLHISLHIFFIIPSYVFLHIIFFIFHHNSFIFLHSSFIFLHTIFMVLLYFYRFCDMEKFWALPWPSCKIPTNREPLWRILTNHKPQGTILTHHKPL